VGLNYIMLRKLILLPFFLLFFSVISFGQLRIRLFADQHSGSAMFTVIEGKYELDAWDDKSIILSKDDPVVFALINGKIAVKTTQSAGFLCDSLILKSITGKDRFSLRVNGESQIIQQYSGNLQCNSDLGILVFINICDVEDYISGVVRAEGGLKNIEYLKSQAVLTRTYVYRNFNRHMIDRYNLCDNTHCQAFNGISTDSLVNRAAVETKGLVVTSKDSNLIVPPFHSNCGGETSASEGVWLSGQPYLKKVVDPYCVGSRNAIWRKSIPVSEWEAYLKSSGFAPGSNDPVNYNFSQITRVNDYRVGSFLLPFRQIRSDLNLRSSFFSVLTDGDSVILKGRGYGHGVGLCQEGAMAMASKGFKFKQIIDFYFSDVIITDVKNIKSSENQLKDIVY
jgi:stage II sporulation protein D